MMTLHQEGQSLVTTGLPKITQLSYYTQNTPYELKSTPQWILFRKAFDEARGKWNKYPTSPNTGHNCSVEDPEHWKPFISAFDAWQRRYLHLDGIGFCLTQGIVVIDLDQSLNDEGEPLEWVKPILALMPPTFIEISQSGHGLHVFVKGELAGRRNRWTLPSGQHIEVYEKDRFIAFTAHPFQACVMELADGSQALDTLYELYGSTPDKTDKSSDDKTVKPVSSTTSLDDTSLLNKMFSSPNGHEIQALWNGDTSRHGNDDSRADLALLNHLRWWTNGDTYRMERLFNQSALGQREKWVKRPDYRERTLNAAIASAQEGYEPSASHAVDAPTLEPEQWEAIIPLKENLHDVIEFDPEWLPNGFSGWLSDCSERMQCPPDYMAVAFMVIISTVVGFKVGIKPKQYDDWLVIPNLWGMIVGAPSVMKTPSLKEAMKPIRKLDDEGKEAYKAEMKEWEALKTIHEIEDKIMKTDIKKSLESLEGTRDQLVADIKCRMKNRQEQEPVRKRYIVSNVTIEKLGMILGENDHAILLFRDELMGLFKSFEKKGHEEDRTFYLETWNGDDPSSSDRVGRGTTTVDIACMSILGGIQPNPLKAYMYKMLNEGSDDDGMMQRFQLAVYPDISPNWQNVDRFPDTAVRSTAFETIRRLSNITPKDVGAQRDGEGGLPYLHFTPDAQECFNTWRTTLENTLRTSDEVPALVSHFAKYRSLIPSLALLIHLADGGHGSVPLYALQKALHWDTYLRSHARRIYGMGQNKPLESAQRLIKQIKKAKLKSPFALRDVYRNGWSGLSTQEDAQHAVDVLEAHNMVQRITQSTTGRNKELIYVHPELLNP